MSEPFVVMTFNIRCDTSEDGRHAWANRRALALAAIRDHQPDLLALQEATVPQWRDIASALPDLRAFTDDDDAALEMSGDYPCGFVRDARFTIRDAGRFWLSETPQEAGSVTWPSDGGPRLCRWARLQDRLTDRALVFASTHVDTNADAWLRSAEVLHRELDRIARGMPIVLAGDFNCAAGSGAHEYLCTTAGYRDAWNEAGHADAGVITFNGFEPYTTLPSGDSLRQWLERNSQPVELFGHYPGHIGAHHNSRIDWILLRGPLTSLAAANDYRTDRGLLPSDHYPVVAQIACEER